jgi:predicted nucleic acid-binding protein
VGLNPGEKRFVTILTEAIENTRAIVVGPVRQEVLSGIRHVKQFEKIRASLEAFPDAIIEPGDYVEAARLDNLCRAVGVQCGGVDMLLCAVVVRNGWSLLTNDEGIIRCISVLDPSLIATRPERRGQGLLEPV